MSKLTGEKLLKVSFLESELQALSQNEEFVDWRAKADTVDDFHQLCLFGFGLVDQESKRHDVSMASATDFLGAN